MNLLHTLDWLAAAATSVALVVGLVLLVARITRR